MQVASLTRRTAIGLALAAASAHLPLLAQEFPSRPIRWIVPYAAGTAPDQTVRIVGDAMAEILRQPIVVENRPGAAGNVGAQMAARAPADGYTWVYSGSPMATNMRMYRSPGFDVLKDFVHVGRIGTSELVVVAHPQLGVASLRELISQARRQPGKLNYATGGVGSPAHMGGALILATAGVDALHVPFKGANESTQAAVGRQVDFALALSTVALPHIQAGRLVPLAVSGSRRHHSLPHVPTLAEEGVPVSITSFGGLSVPAGTPAPVVQRISDALARALANPKALARIEGIGGQFTPGSAAEYIEALRQEIPLTDAMMRAAKLEAQ